MVAHRHVRPSHRIRVPAGCPLTNREYELLVLLSTGATYKEAARAMSIAPTTVASTARTAYAALGVVGRGVGPAIVVMKDAGWLGAPPRQPPRADRAVTPVQLAYAYAFSRLCRERTPRAAAIVTIAYGLLRADHGLPARARTVPDIDALLLRMARALQRPVYASLDRP